MLLFLKGFCQQQRVLRRICIEVPAPPHRLKAQFPVQCQRRSVGRPHLQSQKIQFPGGCSDSESREAFDQFIAKWSTDSKWNPSIFMPKEAARTFLKIVDVSVERLGDINGGGLKAEGIDRNQPYRAMRMDFRDLWNSTISADQLDELGWYANPWVFVYKFQQIGREEALA